MSHKVKKMRVNLRNLIDRYNEYQKQIGNDIRLTQEMLQEETGVSQATISGWINGYRTSINLDIAEKLLSFFRQVFPDVTINDLIVEYDE